MEGKKRRKESLQSSQPEPVPVVNSNLDNSFSKELSPDYTDRSMVLDDVNRQLLVLHHQPECFQELGNDVMYEHVGPFQCVFHIQKLHPPNLLLLEHAELFFQNIELVYRKAVSLKKIMLVTNLADVLNKALQLRDGRLPRSCFAQCCTHLLKMVE